MKRYVFFWEKVVRAWTTQLMLLPEYSLRLYEINCIFAGPSLAPIKAAPTLEHREVSAGISPVVF